MAGFYPVKYWMAGYNLILWDVKKSRCGGEGSATFGLLSLANAGIAKCVDQIYPHLYPQMIGLGGLIF